MQFELVTDSTCSLTQELVDELGIHILPMSLMIDGEQHYSELAGTDTELHAYYELLRQGSLVTTSLPNLGQTKALFESLLEQGRDVLYLAFSSALSSCYSSLDILAQDLQESYPERTIRVVDTLCATGGEGLLVYLAAQKRLQGASLLEVKDYVCNTRSHVAHWFTVDDLMYLMRGGRLSKAEAFAGTMLKVKPILHVDDEGRLVPMDKVRGRKKALKSLVDKLLESGLPLEENTIFINHGDCLEDAQYVASLITEAGGKVALISFVDPVVGAHAGPGVVTLHFLADKR